MRPSETTAGAAWLGNFDAADLPTATLLLDSLQFFSLTTMHARLKAFLEQLGNGGELKTPALVLPERSLDVDEFVIPSSRRAAPIAYQDFHPGASLSPTPGSDGFVGGLLRDFARAGEASNPGSPWIAPDADIAELRVRRCRSIVIVTDYIGTGDQILELAEAIVRNSSIRSWRSYGLIEVQVLAFAATPSAVPRLLESKAIDGVWQVEAAATFETTRWDPIAYESIVELCVRKCRRDASLALGYGDLGGLFANARGVPDNLPAVFWQTHPGWSALFANRVVPHDFAEGVGDYGPTEELSELAERIGQLRLGRNERLEYLRASSRMLLAGLLLIAQAPRSAAELAAALGLDVSEAQTLSDSLRHLHLVQGDGVITERGRDEINAQKRALRRSTASLEGSQAPYYPHALK